MFAVKANNFLLDKLTSSKPHKNRIINKEMCFLLTNIITCINSFLSIDWIIFFLIYIEVDLAN
ncbi:hypothetical protein DSM106972_054020 [Dulcicalothrix desertica PCC 7102]|uniref:Uncharacterized protein n=1 Tax=Dulcicalothrix desertica PCC 7102 TaxID=232991 RepID=A0A3S1IVG1_9CYAN|nr:hypothetical protein DSM106972_054020 [Dulcicalothrix desertica PCC 7102]